MHLDLALAPAFGGNQPSESPLVLMLACFFVCRGQEKACGGICMRFMLCLLNLKWQDFLALLEVGAAPVLTALGRQIVAKTGDASTKNVAFIPSQGNERQQQWASLCVALGVLHRVVADMFARRLARRRAGGRAARARVVAAVGDVVALVFIVACIAVDHVDKQ